MSKSFPYPSLYQRMVHATVLYKRTASLLPKSLIFFFVVCVLYVLVCSTPRSTLAFCPLCLFVSVFPSSRSLFFLFLDGHRFLISIIAHPCACECERGRGAGRKRKRRSKHGKPSSMSFGYAALLQKGKENEENGRGYLTLLAPPSYHSWCHYDDCQCLLSKRGKGKVPLTSPSPTSALSYETVRPNQRWPFPQASLPSSSLRSRLFSFSLRKKRRREGGKGGRDRKRDRQ